MANAELEASFLCGGGLLRHPLLVDNGKTLIVAQGLRLSAHSAATAELQYSLPHSSPIAAMVLHPHSSMRVYVGCEDGSLVLWDLLTASRVQAWNLGVTLERLAICSDAAYVSCGWREQEAGRVMAYDLMTSTFKIGRAKLSAARPLVTSACGDLLATVDRHSALIWQVASFPQKPLVLTHTKPMVCVALSHSGDAVAAGDTSGRILLWRGILQVINAGDCSTTNLLPSTAHWHAGPVRCVTFTSDGAFLLSGGHEGVLVVWNVASGQRAYLPRLGGCLRDIRVCGDSALAVVCTDSNVLHVVDLGALVVRCSLHGLYAPRDASVNCLAPHPRTGLLMVPRAETIQFYDVQRNLHVASLELNKGIAGCHAPVASPHGPQAVPLVLTHAMFDATGELLVTVEQGSAFPGARTSVLKIWKCLQQGSDTSSFARLCDGPFWFDDSVTSVAVHPCGQLVAVACGQGGVCMLQLGGTSGSAAQRGGGSLASGKTLPGFFAQVLKFSPDGSILGVAGSCSLPIFLVDPLKQTHAALAPVDSACSNIRQLCFSADSSHLTVVWDDGCADVSLLSQALNWECQLPAVATAVDPCHSRVALTTAAGTVALLDWRGPALVGVGLTHKNGEHNLPEFGASQATFAVAPRPVKKVPTGVLVLNCAQEVAADPPCSPVSTTPAGALLYEWSAPPSKAAGPPRQGAHGWKAQTDGLAAMAALPSGSHVLATAADLCPFMLEGLLATNA